jgi:hypothetical protein
MVTARVASADTLLVISQDPGYRSAVETAVAPDQVSVRVVDVPTPSLETIATASRDATTTEQAEAATWLLFAEQATLIVYDRGVDRVLVRSLPYRNPLDAAQAAEAARVTRTMLRALRVAEDDAAPPPPPPPPPVVVVAAPAPPESPSYLAIDLDGGVRMRGPGVDAAPTGSFGVIWRPDALGLAAAIRVAPAAELDGAFTGEISDHSLSLLARLPVHLTSRFELISTAGIALHRISLDGVVDEMARTETRFDPAARAGVTGSVALNPTIGVGLAVSADFLLRRQSYAAGSTEVLTVPSVQLGIGLVLLARIL